MSGSLRGCPFRIFYSPADDPLHNFYLPALSASVQYDRSAGFFSSTALAVAAAGVARLIQNGGRMRLLVGAALDEDDVAAIGRGHDLRARVTERLLERFPDPQDALLRRRLEVLAWMVADGTLEFKVVLPRDEQGRPIPAHVAHDYFHPKTGLFSDAAGDQVAFSGSVNESEAGWRKNYESFSVYFSWNETRPYLAQVAIRFQRLWEGQEPDWIALEVPQAVRERLLSYRPAREPTGDPLEREQEKPCREAPAGLETEATPAERVLYQFARDAPCLPNAVGLGAATCAITPWPHQSRVSDTVLARFPERALLCDEVGLGKTIEAGLVLRQTLLSGRVQRCLILAPKSVLKQWQEELYEKFALEIPRYDGGRLWDVHGQGRPVESDDPWDACDRLLASSQLAKRADRRPQILAARGWDLILVDEAHHARRKDFKERIYRPNQLLSLLRDLQERAASLLLLTATPMQIHPLEVWDLLSLLGLGGRWGADEEGFLGFFSEMRKPLREIEWEFVYDLVRDALESGATLDPAFAAQVEADVGPVKWAMLRELPYQPGQRATRIRQLGAASLSHVYEMARRHTPLSRLVFRNTRALLREYEKQGMVEGRVPRRRPRIERIPLRPEEQALYDRLDEYITYFYHKYESERRGLGFVMTVYRRRLTSSFYAVRRSLERRLQFLQGRIAPDQVFQDDDVEQDELALDVTEQVVSQEDSQRFKAELEYVERFIHELKLLSLADSKLERLLGELNRLFLSRPTVLIFTQYTDTMDYLRDQLAQVYGNQVACYSGRGGEVWNGIGWAETTKEEVKTRFRQGDIRVLLGTESASEGLNLQTCGVLINYDMPWNPMRVEQRIGRIDRIGQEFDEVWISNYFYQDTIEDQVYQRLADRINWFEVVVGDLQPILAEVGEATRRLAMLPAAEREAQLEKEIEALRARLQNREVESLNLDAFLEELPPRPTPAAPLNLAHLEELLTRSQATGSLFRTHPEIKGAYLLAWEGQSLPVTFVPGCFEAHPDSVRFLSYGNPLLDELLSSVPGPGAGDADGLVRCHSEGEIRLRGWYAPDRQTGRPKEIGTAADLRDWLRGNGSAQAAPAGFAEQARARFEAAVAEESGRRAELLRRRRVSRYLTERARAQQLLLRAAMVEIALGTRPDLFDSRVYPAAFNEQAVLGLQRHGYPWGALIQLAHETGLAPRSEDPFFARIAADTRESLKGRFGQLSQEARKTVHTLSAASKAAEEGAVGATAVQVDEFGAFDQTRGTCGS